MFGHPSDFQWVLHLGFITAAMALTRGQPDCGVEQRAPPIFGNTAIVLGIGPHSSSCCCCDCCFCYCMCYVTNIACVLMFVSDKGNDLCRNGRVMKGLLFTCYHGNHCVQSIIYDGLCVRPTAFNYLGEYYSLVQGAGCSVILRSLTG